LIAGDFSEQLGILEVHLIGRIIEAPIVERILEVEAELEIPPFLEGEVFLRRNLRVKDSRTRHNIAAGIARGERRGRGEAVHRKHRVLLRLIEPAAADLAPQPEAGHRNAVARKVRDIVSDAGGEVVVWAVGEGETEWIAGLDALDPRDLITADEVIENAVAIEEAAALADGSA